MNSLVVQWLGRHAFSAKFLGSIPFWITKIPQTMLCGQKKKKNNHEGHNRNRKWSKKWVSLGTGK